MNREWRTLLQRSSRFTRFADLGDVSELQGPDRCWLFDLSHLAIIKVSGPDALSFLNGQFSNDVTAIAASGCQLNAWCNPRGQVISFFILANISGDFFMLLPEDLTAVVSPRLAMFKLRANVKIEEAGNDYVLSGAADMETVNALHTGGGIDCPPGGVIVHENRVIIGLPEHSGRVMILSDFADMRSVIENREVLVSFTDDLSWQYLDIKQGLPRVGTRTSEQFLPQMLNLDLLSAINLNKGCFPGQEVIARLHYRGTVKRRLMPASVAADANVGDTLCYDGNDRSIGTVLSCIRDSGEKTIMLVVMELDRPDADRICLSNKPDRSVILHPSPGLGNMRHTLEQGENP